MIDEDKSMQLESSLLLETNKCQYVVQTRDTTSRSIDNDVRGTPCCNALNMLKQLVVLLKQRARWRQIMACRLLDLEDVSYRGCC